MHVRPARPSDAEAIARVPVRSWQNYQAVGLVEDAGSRKSFELEGVLQRSRASRARAGKAGPARTLALALALALLGASAAAAGADLQAPNVVPISDRLVTSGQPGVDALSTLGAQGYRAVIYLAPPGMPDAIAGEAEIVRLQGLEYIQIPINFSRPVQVDFDAFAAAMERLGESKVLVHCQVNMRASSMVFLYRVVVGKEEPERAYEPVARVWSPSGPWKALIVAQLRKTGIAFEPY